MITEMYFHDIVHLSNISLTLCIQSCSCVFDEFGNIQNDDVIQCS